MKIKVALIILTVVAGIIAAALLNINRSRPALAVAVQSEPARQPASEPLPPPAAPVAEPAVTTDAAPAEPSVVPVQPVKPQTVPQSKPKKAARQKPPIQDPVARAALGFVGADPDAEAYWEQAINDPTLPAEERKDLIEDLNEDGLSDSHHPGAQDMPLIASRIRLIEELAPSSMDKVNADAFGEAYKDLVNLYNGLPAD